MRIIIASLGSEGRLLLKKKKKWIKEKRKKRRKWRRKKKLKVDGLEATTSST